MSLNFEYEELKLMALYNTGSRERLMESLTRDAHLPYSVGDGAAGLDRQHPGQAGRDDRCGV